MFPSVRSGQSSLRWSVAAAVAIAVAACESATPVASTPVPAPTMAETPVLPSPSAAQPTATDHLPQLGAADTNLEAIEYGLGPFPIAVSVRGADGWVGGANTSFASIARDLGTAQEAMLNFVRVDYVYDDACPSAPPASLDSPTVEEIADGIASLDDFDVINAAGTSVDGYDARFVELRGPTNDGCENYSMWRTGGVCRCVAHLPQHFRLWVVDVDGTALLIDAVDTPDAAEKGTAPEVIAQLDAMIESIDIEPDL